MTAVRNVFSQSAAKTGRESVFLALTASDGQTPLILSLQDIGYCRRSYYRENETIIYGKTFDESGTSAVILAYVLETPEQIRAKLPPERPLLLLTAVGNAEAGFMPEMISHFCRNAEGTLIYSHSADKEGQPLKMEIVRETPEEIMKMLGDDDTFLLLQGQEGRSVGVNVDAISYCWRGKDGTHIQGHATTSPGDTLSMLAVVADSLEDVEQKFATRRALLRIGGASVDGFVPVSAVSSCIWDDESDSTWIYGRSSNHPVAPPLIVHLAEKPADILSAMEEEMRAVSVPTLQSAIRVSRQPVRFKPRQPPL